MAYTGPIVDTHHHLWDLEQHGDHYDWINDIPAGTEPVQCSLLCYSCITTLCIDSKLASLKHSYLYPDLLADFKGCNVVKSVHVQVSMSSLPLA